jgi:hypothetical protein
VKIVETFSDIQQLGGMSLHVRRDYREGLTRPTRFTPGFPSTNSGRVPFGIHCKTICKGFVVTPIKGTIFGCLKVLHITAPWKNDWVPTAVIKEIDEGM